MCLLVVAWHAHPHYRAVVAANRDEFHSRAAAPMAPWTEPPGLLAGRDLQAGGTWLGLDPKGRFGLVTNYRERLQPRPTAPSRGGLVSGFLADPQPAAAYLDRLEPAAGDYTGFNLLLGDAEQLIYASNRAERFARPLKPGVHGLSNHLLDTPWPKLQRVRSAVQAWIQRAVPDGASDPRADARHLLDIFADRRRTTVPHDPDSGLTPEWEHALSAPFVQHREYGTRCTTVLLIGHDGSLCGHERRFDSAGRAAGEREWRLNGTTWQRPATESEPGNPFREPLL